MKLIYHYPRPYFVIQSDQISILRCDKEFGNPSGHSYASSMIFILLYLDLFHGAKYTKSQADQELPDKFRMILQPICFILGLTWATTIPFSRYLLGVHSLDQITYGSLLGLWSGFFLHFNLRDHILVHMQSIIKQQRAYLRTLRASQILGKSVSLYKMGDSFTISTDKLNGQESYLGDGNSSSLNNND